MLLTALCLHFGNQSEFILSRAVFIFDIVFETGLEDGKVDVESAEHERERFVAYLHLLHANHLEHLSVLVPVVSLEGLTSRTDQSLAQKAKSWRAHGIEQLKYTTHGPDGQAVL